MIHLTTAEARKAGLTPRKAPRIAQELRSGNWEAIRAALVSHGILFGCIPEYRFHPTRKWRFDYAWHYAKLAVEKEGGVFAGGRHTRGKGFRADLQKYNTAVLLGWRILRFLPEQFDSGEAFETIKCALESK